MTQIIPPLSHIQEWTVNPETSTDRRDFLATSALASTAAVLVSGGVFARESNTIKVGLVGCGGRGTGAARNALKADKYVELVAAADYYPENIDRALGLLEKTEVGQKLKVKPEMKFSGLDGYKKVIEASDVVLLCTPPHFRPAQLKAAVAAGKHCFAEKPVAVDAPGVRSVIESVNLAKTKNLNLLFGYCFRWDFAKRAIIERIHNGDIGDILAMHCTYLTGELWHRPTKAEYDTFEYQMKNWYYFNWLSGDHNVEQHCHNHDKASWVMKGEMPVSCVGSGGRQKRTDPKFGNIYDHHSVTYEYKNGVKLFSFCRQQNGCPGDVNDTIYGTKGIAHLMKHYITGQKPFSYEGPGSDMYDQEHIEFFQAIRDGRPFNNGLDSANSTMMSIMGRMASYTGQKITWQMAMNSKEDLTPDYAAKQLPIAPVPIPGVTKFI
jgi:myo-inositol 2-dehydrogenase / D-chiro-inositol 1-dehydrogenase